MTSHETNDTVSNRSTEFDGALQVNARLQDQNFSPDDQIRMRAYELYVERGKQPGDDLGDWLEAEREHQERS